MPELIIRNATHADLSHVAEIWYEAATEGESNPPPMRGMPSLYVHELETEDLVVLQRDEEVVGRDAQGRRLLARRPRISRPRRRRGRST